MEYVELKKLFYLDYKKYDAEYNKRYHSEYAHHINFYVKDHPAFFVVTPHIQQMMLNIQKCDKKVSGLCKELPPKAIDQFSWRCLIDEIVLTNNIEGIHSTRREIDGVLSDIKNKDKKSRFRGLATKYLRLQSGEEQSIKSCEDIRHIYDDLVMEEIKESGPENIPDGMIFRKGSVSVTSDTQKEIHRGLYPEEKIIAAMNDALSYLNNESEELLYRIAVFHYLLGYIHPFYDGNGRLNRFISSYMLTKELEPVLSYRLSYTIKQRIDKYYSAFKIVNDEKNKGDLTLFVTMFIEIIEESITLLAEALSKRLNLLNRYTAIIYALPGSQDDKCADVYNYLIQAELFSENGISTTSLLMHMGISRETLRKKLDIIANASLLKKQKIKKECYYGIDLGYLDALILAESHMI